MDYVYLLIPLTTRSYRSFTATFLSMRPVLRSTRLLGVFLFALLFSNYSSAQSPSPDLRIHQGLPANYDIYQKILHGGGTYVALTLYPWEFFTSKDGVNWT